MKIIQTEDGGGELIFSDEEVKILEKRKSFTTAMIHDSMLIDFSREDKDILKELIKEFSNTDLGIFKVNCSVGNNFGNMRKLND